MTASPTEGSLFRSLPVPAGVYPRVCGGTANVDWPVPPDNGLSPRVRGNRALESSRRPYVASIPARAGEPADDCRVRAQLEVYPRVFVGEPGTENPVISGKWVYPRVCGGTLMGQVSLNVEQGLSPRVRGNRQEDTEPEAQLGSIAACAGEPSCGAHQSTTHAVYPRVCGGNHLRHAVPFRRWGSIPACAGEPRPVRVTVSFPRVYPRVCGGTSAEFASETVDVGLSPRVRGNHPTVCHDCPV